MIAIITGDIINSRKKPADIWLPILKDRLNSYGSSPSHWEIFRGDSFQLAVTPEGALRAALHLKASVKTVKDLDIRLAVGIGERDFVSKRISESNGPAFVRSGDSFENLKKGTLRISTGSPDFDETMNIMFDLAMLTADSWSPTVAQAIEVGYDNPEMNQQDLALLLGKSQSTYSEALKRGGFEEIKRLETYYRKKVKEL